MSSKNNDIILKEEKINDFITNKIKEESSNAYEYEYEYKYKLVVLGCAGATVEVDSIKKTSKPKDNIEKN